MDTQQGTSLHCLVMGAGWGASDSSTLYWDRVARDHFQLSSAASKAPQRRTRRQASTYNITKEEALLAVPILDPVRGKSRITPLAVEKTSQNYKSKYVHLL